MAVIYRHKVQLLAYFLIFFPLVACANAGSPMMWFGVFHSLLLNAFIGVIESEILRKLNVLNRTWIIVVANYVSMIVGFNYIAPHFATISGNRDFWGGQTDYGNYDLNGFFAGMICSFLATLLIEFPFFYYAVRDREARKRVVLPFFVANAITNSVMILIYYCIVRGGGHWGF